MYYYLELIKESIAYGYKFSNKIDNIFDNWHLADEAELNMWKNNLTVIKVIRNLLGQVPQFQNNGYHVNLNWLDLPDYNDTEKSELIKVICNIVTELSLKEDENTLELPFELIANSSDDKNLKSLYAHLYDIESDNTRDDMEYHNNFMFHLKSMTNNKNLKLMLGSDDDEIVNFAVDLILLQYVEEDEDINDGDPVELTKEQYEERSKIIAELYS